MTKLKKAVSLMMACALTVTMFAGCGKKDDKKDDNTSGTSAQSTTAEDSSKEKTEISIAYWGIASAIKPEQEDKVRDYVYDKLNIEIKPVNTTWDDYTQKIQVWAASSQLPDAFAIDAISTPNYKKWITQNIVKQLPTDMSKYPSLKKLFADPGVSGYKYPLGAADAKFYCIPRPTYPNPDMWANDVGVILRKDWMEKVGVTKEPTNMDEFIELMKAFAEKDPDGDGKKNTMGLTMYDATWLQFFFLGYEPGVLAPGQWVRDTKTGKWTQGFMTEDCIKGVVALKKLYDAGGMDLDFATLKGEEGFDKFASGRAGAYAHSGYPSTHNTLLTKFKKNNADIDWAAEWEKRITQLKPFKHADGNYYRQIQPTPWSETYISAKVDDKKTDKILQLFDWFLSDEGFNMMRLGFEGVDYKKEGDKIVITREKDEKGNFIALGKKYAFCGMGSIGSWAQDFSYKNPGTPEALRKVSGNMLDWELKNCKPVNTDLRVQYIDYPSKDKAIAQFKDDLIKAILSKDAEKTWREIVAERRKNGYDQVIKDFNEAAEKLGIK